MTLEALPAHVHDAIEVSESGSSLVLQIVGDLDAETLASIEPAVMVAVASGSSVVLDVAEVTFCDSHGLSLFIAAAAKAREQETPFSVRGLRAPIRHLFEITGLSHEIELIP
jgi:anti-anti-sigma factor